MRQFSSHVFRASHDNIQKLSYSWPRASLQGLNAFKSFDFEQGDTDYHTDDQENGLVAINHFCPLLMGPGTAQGTPTAWHQVSSGTNVALWAPDNATCNLKCLKPVVSLESAWVMRRLLERLLHLHSSAWHQVYELNGVLRRSRHRRLGRAEGIGAGNQGCPFFSASWIKLNIEVLLSFVWRKLCFWRDPRSDFQVCNRIACNCTAWQSLSTTVRNPNWQMQLWPQLMPLVNCINRSINTSKEVLLLISLLLML